MKVKGAISIVIILAAVAGGLVWWVPSLTPIPSPSTFPIPTPKPIAAQPLDPSSGNYEPLTFPDNNLDTSDWQTYRNEEYGFEVRYPRGWGVVVHNKTELHDSDPSSPTDLLGSVGFDPHEPYSHLLINVYARDVEAVLQQRQWIHFADPGPGDVVKARIGNAVRAYYFLKYGKNERYPGIYFVGDSQHGYEISFSTSDDNEAAFEKLLLSFTRVQ